MNKFNPPFLAGRPWVLPLFIYLVSAGVHLAYLAYYGIHEGGDTARYTTAVDKLLSSGIVGGTRLFMFGGYVSYLALNILLFGKAGIAVSIVIQTLLAAVAPLMLYRSVLLIRPGAAGLFAAAACLFFGVTFDMVLWDAYILTDAIFIFVTCVMLYLLVRGLYTGKWLFALVWGALAFTYRPGAQLFLLMTLALWAMQKLISRAANPRKIFAALAVAFVLLCLTAQMGQAWFMRHPPQGDFPLKKVYEKYKRFADWGMVVGDRKYTYHSPPQTYTDYLFLVWDKYLHVHRFIYPDYSRAHKLINWTYYLPYYLLALFCLWAHWKKSGPGAARPLIALAMAMVWVHGFTSFFSLFAVSFDWRYQIVNMPMIGLLAVLGLLELVWPQQPAENGATA